MSSHHERLEPRRKPRQVRAELTRARILTAAAHVFAEHGYAAGTTNRIAEQARVSIGSLYQYFPNKDAILAELLVRHIDHPSTEVDGTPGTGGRSSLEQLVRQLVREAIENHRHDPQLLRIMIEEAPRSAELLDAVARHERTRVARVRELFADHPEVQVRDLETATTIVVTTVELVTHKLMAAPNPVGSDQIEDGLVTMLTRYLQSPPDERR